MKRDYSQLSICDINSGYSPAELKGIPTNVGTLMENFERLNGVKIENYFKLK
jgi:hypothetical protein